MKKKDLDRALLELGWHLKREGANHEIWTNGEQVQPVPRHREIKEGTARGIIRFAKSNPGKEKKS